MELLQLKYFCDAAKSENFSKTAKKYAVPPSDISQSIKRLEKELGVSLFDRGANRVALSSQGKEFFESAFTALSILENAKAAFIGKQERLSILINCNRRIVMRAIERFRAVFPEVEIHVSHFLDPKEHDFDLFVASEEGYEGLLREELLTEEIALALPKTHPLAMREGASLMDFCEEPFVTLNSASSLSALTERLCQEAGFKPHVAITTDDPFYLRRCVELGLGVALVPVFSWQGQFSDSVKLLTLAGVVRQTFIYTKRKKSQLAERFVAILKQECERER